MITIMNTIMIMIIANTIMSINSLIAFVICPPLFPYSLSLGCQVCVKHTVELFRFLDEGHMPTVFDNDLGACASLF